LPPSSTLFSYTTLFRSGELRAFGRIVTDIAAPASWPRGRFRFRRSRHLPEHELRGDPAHDLQHVAEARPDLQPARLDAGDGALGDRKSTRLNSSHVAIS